MHLDGMTVQAGSRSVRTKSIDMPLLPVHACWMLLCWFRPVRAVGVFRQFN
jgi:hypothetical protein